LTDEIAIYRTCLLNRVSILGPTSSRRGRKEASRLLNDHWMEIRLSVHTTPAVFGAGDAGPATVQANEKPAAGSFRCETYVHLMAENGGVMSLGKSDSWERFGVCGRGRSSFSMSSSQRWHKK
jgi:hypothetical protein